MECINDIYCGRYALVGIRDFINCPHPENVLFINDIPGLTLKLAPQVANEEQRTGYNLLNDKIIHASKLIINKFDHLSARFFDVNSIIESREISSFGTSTYSPSTSERGLTIRKSQSETAKIFIEEIYIRTVESGIVEVKLYDGDSVKTYEVSVIGNKTNVATIRYKAKRNEVKIVFDQTNFTTYGCEIVGSSSCRSCGGKRGNKMLEIHGWDGSHENYNCYGLGVLANVQCFSEELICQLLPRMAFMILYQSGIEICTEILASQRITPVVTFGKEKAEQILNYCTTRLKEEEDNFTRTLPTFLKNTRGECFVCKGSRVSYAIPG